ncbi:MAG TPA: cytochrome C oxidase subunit IV family protein [Aromatoleum sp.]|uniref:cytochrome C oxidase subunit IV family protein n=1 Tax=Aromatoleum sp. TaxID=2307007 RepID=UPI002B45C8DF|nr:cytochrome C oxidase subunit IV family protein [Aromatoleum sp.]HJV28870.1 cytochrome C oxidase subunit IV family protein [Aromatoleum sp.]
MQSSTRTAVAHASAHGTPERAATIWAILIAATMVTWTIGERGEAGPAVAALLFAIAFAKGSLIILDYMALRRAPRMWAGLVLGWMGLVCALIGIAYWKGLAA